MRSVVADIARGLVELAAIKVYRLLDRLEDYINHINDWEVSK